jgi:hypothetical protein
MTRWVRRHDEGDRMKRWFLALVLTACGSDGTPPIADATAPDAAAGSSQVPPRGQSAIEPWLAAGFYQSWHCEAQVEPSRGGAHGRDRICTNDVLHAAAPPFPAGSASVIEMYDAAERTNGFAVSLKVAGSGDQSWYWYERAGSSPTSRPVADAVAYPACGTNCHADAPTDNVFIRAP